MVNNFKNITQAELFNIKNEGDFYFIQIFQRRKDNPDLEHGVIRIKSYCVYKWEELDELMPRIIKYCEDYNARAYLRLNKQNATDVTLRCIEQLTKNLREGNQNKGRKVWDSVSGQGGSRDYWVLDIDKEHLDHNPDLLEEIHMILWQHFAEKRGFTPNMVENPTKTGIHLIVPPFDARIMDVINRQFRDAKISNIQIQKDANTLLYTT